MKMLVLPLIVAAAVAAGAAKKKAVGPCDPYAEKCPHCSDCSQCRHCAVDKGFCSVCLKR